MKFEKLVLAALALFLGALGYVSGAIVLAIHGALAGLALAWSVARLVRRRPAGA